LNVKITTKHLFAGLALLGTAFAVASAYGQSTRSTIVPLVHAMPVGKALKTLHAGGLRTSFGAIDSPCGDALPYAWKQMPHDGRRVQVGSTVRVTLQHDPYPSSVVPIHHEKWAYVPKLVGHDFGYVRRHLHAIDACVHLKGADSTDATRVVVVSQSPSPGTRVPAYGVRRPNGGFVPTTVALTLATP
jgi:hypothetical protein